MITVKLDATQLDAAWIEGIARQHLSTVNNHRTNNPRHKRAELMYHVGAAMVEIAAAHYLEVEWTGRNNGHHDPHLHDLHPNIEARFAVGRGPLRARDKDRKWPPSTPYLLGWIDGVFTDDRVFLVGWETLGNIIEFGEEREWLNTNVYEYNPTKLRPMRSLKELAHAA